MSIECFLTSVLILRNHYFYLQQKIMIVSIAIFNTVVKITLLDTNKGAIWILESIILYTARSNLLSATIKSGHDFTISCYVDHIRKHLELLLKHN